MALSADALIQQFIDQGIRRYPVAASTTIYKGASVCLDASGYLTTAAPGLIYAGIAYEQKDNSSGSNGDLNCRVFTEGDFALTISGIAIADAGRSVYATDDNTYSLSPTNGVRVGRVMHRDEDETTKGVVRIEPGLAFNGRLIIAGSNIDCASDSSDTSIPIIPANMNENGLAIIFAQAIVTEVFAGSSEDQGVVALDDTADTAKFTFTATDGGADAVNDAILAVSSDDHMIEAGSGEALSVVTAGRGLKLTVDQQTSGGTPTGGLHVVVMAYAL